MSAILQHPHKTDPEPPVEEDGDNHVTGMDEPDKEAPQRKEEPPKKKEDPPVEEQHDAGHGDIHPSNEVWK